MARRERRQGLLSGEVEYCNAEQVKRRPRYLLSKIKLLYIKKRGNPGIRNLKVQNRNLLMKWLWRFIIEDNTLWKEAETTKYGELNPRCIETVTTPYG